MILALCAYDGILIVLYLDTDVVWIVF